MSALSLPRLISDGMILQHGKLIHVWGWDTPGKKVSVSFLGKTYTMFTNEEGTFSGYMDPAQPGGPYVLTVSDEDENEIIVKDVLVGDVYFCTGQSNMELPIMRVKDRFPEETANCENDQIRTFKIIENGDFHAPIKELVTGEWKSACPENIMNFSATAYFFAMHLYELTGVPVGFINVSLGGSRLESWISKEMIEGELPYPQVMDEDLEGRDSEAFAEAKEKIRLSWLDEMKQYADDDFVASQVEKNTTQSLAWHKELDEKDQGLSEQWQQGEWNGSPVEIPFFFRDTELKGFIGAVWFKKKFVVPAEMAGKSMHVWLGTIVDSDTCYVNGVKVGETPYEYPPRKYEIPEGLLVEGENTIVLRVIVENGRGRFTINKMYAVWSELGEIDLKGTWEYQIGTTQRQVPPTDFVHWKPTVLYNGMTAPCHNYTIGGILWYQGESNAGYSVNYLDALKMLIGGYRKMWKDESIPFYCVQLPNFTIDSPGSEYSGWRELREKQRMAQAIPDCYMVVTMDLGEDNDLHPLNKKEIGRRLALLAYEKEYRKVYRGESPAVHVAHVQTLEEREGVYRYEVQLLCRNVGSGLYASSEDKGMVVKDFEVIGVDGTVIRPNVQVLDTMIILTSDEMTEEPAQIRYIWADTNSGALVYNSYDLPMSPFIMRV